MLATGLLTAALLGWSITATGLPDKMHRTSINGQQEENRLVFAHFMVSARDGSIPGWENTTGRSLIAILDRGC